MLSIHMMDLRQADMGLLVALDVLIAERSVTKAAKRLGLSQPAMSAQLARLRDLFQDPLLVPSGKQMVLTPRAIDIRDPLHGLLDELSILVRERQPFDPASADRTFRIMATDYLHRIVSIRAMGALAETAPFTRLAMHPHDASRAWQALESDEIDILIASDRLTPKDANTLILTRERFVFVQRRSHPRGVAPLDLDTLCDLEHVLVSPEGGGFYGATDETLQAMGRRRRVVGSLPSFLLVAPLIATSNLVAVLPESLAQTMTDTIELFDLPFESVQFDVVMSWHARRENDPAHRWLRSEVVRAFNMTREQS